MDKSFCLKQTGEKLCLDKKHAYYYQAQTQLFVCDVEYADFCVCTFLKDGNDYDDGGIHIERITKDVGFWKDCVEKACNFFITCLLPEILGSWYTRPTFKKHSLTDNTSSSPLRDDGSPLTDNTLPLPDVAAPLDDATSETSRSSNGPAGHDTSTSAQTYCYYNGPEEGDMIACDNPMCTIEWFHATCLQMKRFPKGKAKWYCPDCRVLPQFKFSRKTGVEH